MSHRALVGSTLAAVALVCGSADSPDAGAAGISWRISEPVVVPGSELGPYQGLPVGEVGVWAFDGQRWTNVRSQVDQRDAREMFVAHEDDDLLDANDELVFYCDSLGIERVGGGLPPGTGSDRPPVRITVTDPLRPEYTGYAYVVSSREARERPPLVRYDEETGEVTTDSYVLGFASPDEDGFLGVKHLSLMGDPSNLVDRSKIRVTVPQLGQFDEESLAQLGGTGLFEPRIEGPVRLVMDAVGSSMAYAARATLFNLELQQDIPLIPGLEFRVSLDFSPEAAGATYRAENLTRGVTIDGEPDTVRQLQYPMWREIEFEQGRLITLAEGERTPLLIRTYYKDASTPDEDDTGDKMSYGDNGVSASSLGALVEVGFLGQMVALGKDDPMTAQELAEQLANPIEVQVTIERLGPHGTVYIPIATQR